MLRSLRVLEVDKVNAPAGVETLTAFIREGRRWTDTVLGFYVQGRDQRIGDIQDLIVDDQTGHVRYLVIKVHEGSSGRRVLLAPNWTHRISWGERKIYVEFSQQVIQGCPAWARGTLLTREYEVRLHDHYGRPPYWATGQEAGKPGQRFRGEGPGVSSVDSPA